jgi:hypothetical protein
MAGKTQARCLPVMPTQAVPDGRLDRARNPYGSPRNSLSFLRRDREFESPFLQGGVLCEPGSAGGRGRNAATRGHSFGREFGRQITFGRTSERWLRRSSIRKPKRAEKGGVGTEGLGIHEAMRAPIVGERLALFIPGEEPMIRVAGSVDCQIMRIGIANKKVQIDLASLEQAMNQMNQSENQ